MAYIFEYLIHEFGNSIREGNFYDLGSGTGKGVLAMALIYRFKNLIGIEFLENLYFLVDGWFRFYPDGVSNRSIVNKYNNVFILSNIL